MGQVALTEGHEEADAFDARNVESKAFDLFVVEQVHIFLTNTIKVVFTFDFHWFGLYPVAVFPVGAFCRNLTDIDFRVKVGCERIAVVATIAVEDVDVVDLIKFMFERISGEYTGNARVKTAAQQCGDASLFKAFTVSPLPAVLKFCSIFWLIVCGINIVGLGCKAGIHDGQILIWQSEV